MNCPSCGVEVVEHAGFCHKCGQRLVSADEQASVGEQQEATPVPECFPDRPLDETESALTPGEKFKQAANARNAEDEPEEELWQGGYSSKAMIGAWILSGLISIALLLLAIYASNGWGWLWKLVLVSIVLLWIYQFGKLFYRRMNVRYRMTTQRFIHETGILRRVTDRIEMIDIDDITFEQAVIERLVGVGTISIKSSDTTHPEIVLLGIENVKEVANKIDDARRLERRRRGLHIESI